MKVTIAVPYLFFLTVTLLLLAALLHWKMAGSYFVATERGFIADFIPPFVRGDGDFYMKPESTVYAIWAVFAMVTLVLPILASWAVLSYRTAALRKAWR